MRWAEQVAHLIGKSEEKGHLGYPGVDRTIILR